jgi:hypothetical protein
MLLYFTKSCTRSKKKTFQVHSHPITSHLMGSDWMKVIYNVSLSWGKILPAAL